jgi:hypothetical protein
MSHQGQDRPHLDIEALSPDVSAAVEAAIAGASITVSRSGRSMGVLEFSSNVLEGTPIEKWHLQGSGASVPDGVSVVATAMRLSDAARRRLSDELGENYIVLDIRKVPASTDVLLIHPISPQLLGILRTQFPEARVVITEIEDGELGIHYAGPVSRMLDAGAGAYLPPRPIAELAANLHAYLTRTTAPMLESDADGSKALSAAPEATERPSRLDR